VVLLPTPGREELKGTSSSARADLQADYSPSAHNLAPIGAGRAPC
jgi:hypothetical protein